MYNNLSTEQNALSLSLSNNVVDAKTAVAMYDCNEVDDNHELTFKKGTVFVNLVPADKEEGEGWYYGTIQYTTQRGLIPSNYVQLIDDNKQDVLASSRLKKLPSGATPMFPMVSKSNGFATNVGVFPFPTGIRNEHVVDQSNGSGQTKMENIGNKEYAYEKNMSSPSSQVSSTVITPTLSRKSPPPLSLVASHAPPLPSRKNTNISVPLSPFYINNDSLEPTRAPPPLPSRPGTYCSDFRSLPMQEPQFPPISSRSYDPVHPMISRKQTTELQSSITSISSMNISNDKRKGKNPFLDESSEENWDVPSDKVMQYASMFTSYDKDKDGLLSGKEVRDVFTKSGLDKLTLGSIWALCDIDDDGQLDKEEFILGMYLIDERLKGQPVPNKLPLNLIPPSKRPK